MKNRFRLVRRGDRGGTFYAFDTTTRNWASLKTLDRDEAVRIVQAKNESGKQNSLNLQLARVYMQQSDPALASRTWQDVMDEFTARSVKTSTKQRNLRATQSKCFDLIRARKLVETSSDELRAVIKNGGVFVNHFLRCMHNLAQGLGWLPWPIIPVKLWPEALTRGKRGITDDEHQAIIQAEQNPERRLYYELLWEIGAAQSDAASLSAENIDWKTKVLSFQRMKTGEWCYMSVGQKLEEILRALPSSGPLFPRISKLTPNCRSAEFYRRCHLLEIKGVSLHSYRHGWAARAKEAGMPERYAMEALGHNSRAVHKFYSRGARVKIPSLEEYEAKVIKMPNAKAG